jgi:acetyl esterase/lipase
MGTKHLSAPIALGFIVTGLAAVLMAVQAAPIGVLQVPTDPAGPVVIQQSPESRDVIMNVRVVRNVAHPTLTAYLPVRGSATRTAIIIAPGGGFTELSIGSEGEDVARWLARHGIAAFVLKYRLNPTPKDPAAFEASVKQLIANASANPRFLKELNLEESVGAKLAMADGVAAVRLLRTHSADYGVAPDRIGMLGFSAGGYVALYAGTTPESADRPNFVGSIYGALPPGRELPAKVPPMFLAVAADDPLQGGASLPIFEAWRARNGSAELHEFAHGGHGFGMSMQGTSSDHWIDEFYWWLRSQELLSPVGKH